MATLRFRPKDPNDLLDYSVDVKGEIDPDASAPTNDTVSAAVWTVPGGLTKTAQTESGTVAVVWLDGGTAGEEYQIHMTVTSAQGRRVDRDILIKVFER